MANPRVHELAAELGLPSNAVMAKLKEFGAYTRSASSSVPPPVARRLREAVQAGGSIIMPLSAAAARAFDRVPAGLPALVDELLGGAEQRQVLAVLRTARPSRFLLHVGPAATAAVAARSETLLSREELVEPRGVVALRTGSELTLLSWRLEDAHLELSLLRVTREQATVVERGRAQAGAGVFRPVSGDAVARSLAILARIPHVVPTTSAGDGVEVAGAPAAPIQPRPEADVQVIYLTRHAGEAAGLRPAVHRASRWVVRGHWRNQWYPSLNSHRRIWIDEHEAGNPAAPLPVRPVVYALR